MIVRLTLVNDGPRRLAKVRQYLHAKVARIDPLMQRLYNLPTKLSRSQRLGGNQEHVLVPKMAWNRCEVSGLTTRTIVSAQARVPDSESRNGTFTARNNPLIVTSNTKYAIRMSGGTLKDFYREAGLQRPHNNPPITSTTD